MFCNRCGHRNPDRSNFCSSCGAPLPPGGRGGTDAEPNTTAIPAIILAPEGVGEPYSFDIGDLLHGVPEGGAVLVVTRGPNEGSRFVLGAEEPGVVTIGRHPDSDIFLDDITVSRRHAEVRREGGRFWAKDVGSLNGTYLNRHSIESGPLTNGDELQVGKFRLLFLVPAAAQAAAGSVPAPES